MYIRPWQGFVTTHTYAKKGGTIEMTTFFGGGGEGVSGGKWHLGQKEERSKVGKNGLCDSWTNPHYFSAKKGKLWKVRDELIREIQVPSLIIVIIERISIKRSYKQYDMSPVMYIFLWVSGLMS